VDGRAELPDRRLHHGGRAQRQIKRWRRDWKLALIEVENPPWRDLAEEWLAQPEGPLSWMQR